MHADLGRDQRAIRVFVSSTFRDMQAERDELVKRVFPQLRHMCEQRGIAWSEVDLRWGVTDEQAADGAVLPICLAEIERTRPYFIGLLGQRYGWVPDAIPPDLAGSLGWLTDDHGRSVTELEILHGVLNAPAEAAGHAFFYLRDPDWVARLPDAERAVLVEPDPVGAARLEALRERVRRSGHPVGDYGSPESLGDAVLADFAALVDRLFPAGGADDRGAQLDAVHAAFGRARFGVHVRRPAVEAALAAAAGDAAGLPLLVTGAPGAGASSAVTTFATRWAAEHPDAAVVVHHCDADADATDFRLLTARLISALDPSAPFAEVAESLAGAAPGAVGAALARAAHLASSAGHRMLIVIDGVDRLDEGGPGDRAPDLRWLTPALAGLDGVRWIVTGAGERARAAFAHRGWAVYELPGLDDAERRTIAEQVLAVGAKALDADHLDALVSAPGTANPRYLRTVLDELRQHGEHFTLRTVIDRLTGAATVDDLLELVFARYEADFEGTRPGLVGDVMRALWAARHGLSEAELLDLLTPGDDHLPQRVWAPLHLAAEHGLVSRGGLLSFAHADFRRAVEDRYLTSPEARRAAHATVAAYFAAQPLGPRQADELGWQYAEAGDRTALRATLGDLAWAELAYRRHAGDLRRLWARVAGDSGLAAVAGELRTAYAAVLADPAGHDEPRADGASRQLVWGVARVFADAGAADAAAMLQRYLVGAARESAADRRLAAALVNYGATLLSQGDVERAGPAFEEAARVSHSRGDAALLAAAVGNLAIVRRDQRRFADAEELFAQADRRHRQLSAAFDVQANLGGWGELARRQNDLDRAMQMFVEQELICRELADPVSIGRSLSGQAVVRADQGEPAEALGLLEQYAALARSEGDLRGLAEAQLNIALTRIDVGDAEPGASAAADAQQLARALGDPDLLARALVAAASASAAAGQWALAERQAREAELTARSSGSLAVVARALGITGTARREQGDLRGAAAAHAAEALAANESGDAAAIGTAAANLGNVAAAEQRFDVALGHYAAAETALRAAGTIGALLPVLANRAQIHHLHERGAEALGDYAEAAQIAARMGRHAVAAQWGQPALQLAYQLGDTARAEPLWAVLAGVARAQGDDAGLQRALGERALLLINRAQPVGVVGDPGNVDQDLLAEAAALLDEQEVLCRRLGDPVGLAQCVGNRAIVLRYRGDLAGALACVDEQLEIASRSGNAQGALFATANRGELLGLLGRVTEALAALQQARATAAQYGLAPMAQQLDQMIAALQHRN